MTNVDHEESLSENFNYKITLFPPLHTVEVERGDYV
jgi:hypothetical protein